MSTTFGPHLSFEFEIPQETANAKDGGGIPFSLTQSDDDSDGGHWLYSIINKRDSPRTHRNKILPRREKRHEEGLKDKEKNKTRRDDLHNVNQTDPTVVTDLMHATLDWLGGGGSVKENNTEKKAEQRDTKHGCYMAAEKGFSNEELTRKHRKGGLPLKSVTQSSQVQERSKDDDHCTPVDRALSTKVLDGTEWVFHSSENDGEKIIFDQEDKHCSDQMPAVPSVNAANSDKKIDEMENTSELSISEAAISVPPEMDREEIETVLVEEKFAHQHETFNYGNNRGIVFAAKNDRKHLQTIKTPWWLRTNWADEVSSTTDTVHGSWAERISSKPELNPPLICLTPPEANTIDEVVYNDVVSPEKCLGTMRCPIIITNDQPNGLRGKGEILTSSSHSGKRLKGSVLRKDILSLNEKTSISPVEVDTIDPKLSTIRRRKAQKIVLCGNDVPLCQSSQESTESSYHRNRNEFYSARPIGIMPACDSGNGLPNLSTTRSREQSKETIVSQERLRCDKPAICIIDEQKRNIGKAPMIVLLNDNDWSEPKSQGKTKDTVVTNLFSYHDDNRLTPPPRAVFNSADHTRKMGNQNFLLRRTRSIGSKDELNCYGDGSGEFRQASFQGSTDKPCTPYRQVQAVQSVTSFHGQNIDMLKSPSMPKKCDVSEPELTVTATSQQNKVDGYDVITRYHKITPSSPKETLLKSTTRSWNEQNDTSSSISAYPNNQIKETADYFPETIRRAPPLVRSPLTDFNVGDDGIYEEIETLNLSEKHLRKEPKKKMPEVAPPERSMKRPDIIDVANPIDYHDREAIRSNGDQPMRVIQKSHDIDEEDRRENFHLHLLRNEKPSNKIPEEIQCAFGEDGIRPFLVQRSEDAVSSNTNSLYYFSPIQTEKNGVADKGEDGDPQIQVTKDVPPPRKHQEVENISCITENDRARKLTFGELPWKQIEQLYPSPKLRHKEKISETNSVQKLLNLRGEPRDLGGTVAKVPVNQRSDVTSVVVDQDDDNRSVDAMNRRIRLASFRISPCSSSENTCENPITGSSFSYSHTGKDTNQFLSNKRFLSTSTIFQNEEEEPFHSRYSPVPGLQNKCDDSGDLFCSKNSSLQKVTTNDHNEEEIVFPPELSFSLSLASSLNRNSSKKEHKARTRNLSGPKKPGSSLLSRQREFRKRWHLANKARQKKMAPSTTPANATK